MIHLCWLIDPWRASRDKYLAAWRDLGWDVVLWVHFNVLAQPCLVEFVPGVRVRDANEVMGGSPSESAYRYAVRHGDHGTASDLFRYEALVKHGGAYSDVDVLPLAAATPRLLDEAEPRFGYCPRFNSLEVRFIVSPLAGHPLLRALRDRAVANETAWIARGGWALPGATGIDVLSRTAPLMARPVVEEYARASRRALDSYLLRGVVDDQTPEGAAEHFGSKVARAKRIAAGSEVDGSGPRPPSSCLS